MSILKLFIGLAGLYGARYWTAGRRDEFVWSAGRGRTRMTTNVYSGRNNEQCLLMMLKDGALMQEGTSAKIMFVKQNKGHEGESARRCFVFLGTAMILLSFRRGCLKKQLWLGDPNSPRLIKSNVSDTSLCRSSRACVHARAHKHTQTHAHTSMCTHTHTHTATSAPKV